MSESSNTLHEPAEVLSPKALDQHRAVVSLMEELEATDWYEQRAQATSDPSLKAILAHNRDEEKEHAAMLIEWLRRNDSRFDHELRSYLFQDAEDLTNVEDGATGEQRASGEVNAHQGSLNIGSLRETGEGTP